MSPHAQFARTLVSLAHRPRVVSRWTISFLYSRYYHVFSFSFYPSLFHVARPRPYTYTFRVIFRPLGGSQESCAKSKADRTEHSGNCGSVMCIEGNIDFIILRVRIPRHEPAQTSFFFKKKAWLESRPYQLLHTKQQELIYEYFST